MHNLLKSYPVIVEIPVAWGDLDAFQHVNNAIYFRYFETARIVYFERLQLLPAQESAGIGPILHSINCRFRIPLTYPDTISVGVKVIDVLDDRFTIESCVVSHQYQKVAAEGSGIVVAFDYRTQKKACWPVEIRQKIAALEDIS